jgi:murein DD-endopeptidase MepM/ murein hydrolase activator NlpD
VVQTVVQPVVQPAQRPVAAPAAEKASPSQRSGGSYRVQAGDTLYAISRRLNVPIRAIIDANGLAAPYSLQVSDTLLIPQPRSHQVARGETVYGISRVYGVDMSELVRQNNITAPYSISTGRLLIIPSGKTPAQQLAGGSGASAQPIETAAGVSPTPTPGALEAAAPTAAATAPVPRRSLAAIPKPPPLEGGKFLWPIEGKVLATFGPRKDGQHNDGINILAPRGAPVRAAENGVVAYAGEELRGFGRLLLIKHADGWVTAYAHNDSLLVQRGDKVRRGQPVAKVGSTGSVARPQLYFEVRKGSRAIDPRQLLRPSSISSAG